jgi:CubicO group peptidase (beta-lactamase class C family)
MIPRPYTRLILFLIAIAAAPGCSEPVPPTPEPLEPDPWPTAQWSRSAPEEEGVDSSRLVSLLEQIASRTVAMHSLLVARHGRLVLDVHFFPYDGSRAHDLGSVTKSLTSTALGAALQNGYVAAVDTPVVSFFPDRMIANDDDRKRAMTLTHALTMTSGLACESGPGEPTLLEMQNSSDWLGFALDRPMDQQPGTAFRYCSPVSHLISGVVQSVAGQPTDVVLRDRVLGRIGVEEMVWPRDPQGVTHGWGDARLRPPDLARLGLLFLHRGRWDQDRILDAGWIERATSHQVAASDGPAEGYGYQWWTATGGAFYASGRGGQYLYVAPALDLIVATTGSAAPEELAQFEELLRTELLPAIVSNDPLPPNQDGKARLDGLVSAAALPPRPQATQPPPPIAAIIGGKTFSAMPNALGWDAFTLSFAGEEALIALELGGTRQLLSVGLDGVPRVTRGIRFATGPRYEDSDVALEGRWIDDASLQITFDTIDRIDAGTLTFTFADGAANVDLYERTFLLTHFTFRAEERSPSP